jgi:hypothetical protein
MELTAAFVSSAGVIDGRSQSKLHFHWGESGRVLELLLSRGTGLAQVDGRQV